MYRNLKIIILIIVPVVGISIYLAYFFINKFHPTDAVKPNDAAWSKLFVANEYPELKDLGKSFLTLLIGLFVASITFSEKIVNHQSSSPLSRSLLFICWIALLFSIVLVGIGLCFAFGCFEQALHDQIFDDDLYDLVARCFIYAGLCFGFALSFMLTAGAISFFRPKVPEIH